MKPGLKRFATPPCGRRGPGGDPLRGLLDWPFGCPPWIFQELLAASDEQGNLQVWDASALRHSCRFPLAHRGPV